MLNAELPLVRVNERNNFRTALINYQRQRRTLHEPEDTIKLLLRTEIRSLQTIYLNYEIHEAELHPDDPPEGPGVRADHRPARRSGGIDQTAKARDADDQPDQLPAVADYT